MPIAYALVGYFREVPINALLVATGCRPIGVSLGKKLTVNGIGFAGPEKRDPQLCFWASSTFRESDLAP